MNDIQRESFIKNVAEVFETIKKQINGEKIEELKKIETWNRNIYTGYRYAKTGENNKYALSQYTYSLIGHYHFGKNNPEKNFSVINNGIDNPLLFTAILKDGTIEKMYVSELNNNGIKLIKSSYETEVYNRNFQYKK